MDEIVHIVSSSGPLARMFARVNSIPWERVKAYVSANDLYGSRFGRFVYVITAVTPRMEHEVNIRSEMQGTTVLRCSCGDVVERTWS